MNNDDWQERLEKILRDYNSEKDRLRLLAASLDVAGRKSAEALLHACSISATMKLGPCATSPAALAQHGEPLRRLDDVLDASPVLRRARLKINYEEQPGTLPQPSWEAQFITQRLVAANTHVTHTLHAVRAETLPAAVELAEKSLDAVKAAFKELGNE